MKSSRLVVLCISAKHSLSKIETSRDPNTDNMTVRVYKHGQTNQVTFTPADIIEHANQGLTMDQIIDRAAKTLITALDREADEMPF